MFEFERWWSEISPAGVYSRVLRGSGDMDDFDDEKLAISVREAEAR